MNLRDVEPDISALELDWTANFEGGNASGVRWQKDGSIAFEVPPDPGEGEYLWFYFEVRANGQKPPEFVLKNAHGAHQSGRRWDNTKPFFSTDKRNWFRASNSHYGRKRGLLNMFSAPVFRFRSPVAAGTLEVAYFQPYTGSDLEAFLKEYEDLPEVRLSSLGTSEEGRSILRIDIAAEAAGAKKRPEIWIVTREHPGETPASFVLEGMINAILSMNSGRRLLKDFNFVVIPLLNVDGVFHGHYYHNSRGVNLARDWLDFKALETRALRDALQSSIERGNFRLLLNLHSSNDPQKGHFFLTLADENLRPDDAEWQDKLLRIADSEHPQMQGNSTVVLYDLPGITGNAIYAKWGAYCLYFESNYSQGADGSQVTVASLREVGVALVRTLTETLKLY